MRAYQQLTEEDSIEIYDMNQAGKRQKSDRSNRGHSSQHDSPGIGRNVGLRGSRPKQN